jgi:hypothetical protein
VTFKGEVERNGQMRSQQRDKGRPYERLHVDERVCRINLRHRHCLICVERTDGGSTVTDSNGLHSRPDTPSPHFRSRPKLALMMCPPKTKKTHGRVRKSYSQAWMRPIRGLPSQRAVSGNIPKAVVQRVYPNESCR